MKASTKVYIVFIAVTLAVGALAAALTMGSMEDYGNLPKPSFAPPGWLFPIVWTILYVLMAVAAARVWMSGSEYRDKAIILYAVQLTVNFSGQSYFQFQGIHLRIRLAASAARPCHSCGGAVCKVRQSGGLAACAVCNMACFCRYPEPRHCTQRLKATAV